jgi:hypothetical protein
MDAHGETPRREERLPRDPQFWTVPASPPAAGFAAHDGLHPIQAWRGPCEPDQLHATIVSACPSLGLHQGVPGSISMAFGAP